MLQTELRTESNQAVSEENVFLQFLRHFVPIALILIGGALASVQMRQEIALGDSTTEHVFDTAVPGWTGWHEPGLTGSWMSDTRSMLPLPFNENNVAVSFRATAITGDIIDSLDVTVNGFELPLSYTTDNFDWRTYKGMLPEALMESQPETLEFVFTVERVVSPISMGLSDDARELGVKFERLTIERSGGLVTESLNFYLAVVLGAGLVSIVLLLVPSLLSSDASASFQRTQFWAAVAAALLATGLVAAIEPDITLIQLFYFIGVSVVIAALTILWTPKPNSFGDRLTIFEHLKRLYENRTLLGIWVQYNVRSRYAQAFLGILWIIIQPLTTAIILSFVFSQIFRKFDTGEAPYISFYLAAIIAWRLFSQGITTGAISLTNAAGLLTQVYFPREILILVRLGEVLVDTFFTFMAMIILNAILGIFPNVNYLYLPILLAIQLMFLIGLSFFISYLSMMIRDIPQLVAIIIQFMFYLTPILYPLSAIPERYILIVLLNPLAPLVDAYRTVILYNAAPDFTTLYYPIVIGGILFYSGYVFFKKNERQITDYI